MGEREEGARGISERVNLVERGREEGEGREGGRREREEGERGSRSVERRGGRVREKGIGRGRVRRRKDYGCTRNYSVYYFHRIVIFS